MLTTAPILYSIWFYGNISLGSTQQNPQCFVLHKNQMPRDKNKTRNGYSEYLHVTLSAISQRPLVGRTSECSEQLHTSPSLSGRTFQLQGNDSFPSSNENKAVSSFGNVTNFQKAI